MAAIGSFSPGGSSTTASSNPYRDPFAAAVKAAPSAVANPYAAQTAKQTTAYPTYPTNTAAGSATTTVAKGSSAATASPAAPPAAAGSGVYDLSTDPIVQKIQALNAANYGQAVAGAQASAKQDLIDSGFDFTSALAANPDLAATINSSPIGSVLTDQATGEAAAANPYSTAAGLLNTHNQNNTAISQGENDNNLFYSSDRGNQLGTEANNYLGSVAGAQGSLASTLSGLLGGLTTEQQTEQQNLADTIETERENVITNALASGQVMLGYDSNGNPIFGAAPTTAGAGGGGGAAVPGTTPGGAGSGVGATPAVVSKLATGALPFTATLLQDPNVRALLPAGPTAVAGTPNKTGLSANKKQGVFAIH